MSNINREVLLYELYKLRYTKSSGDEYVERFERLIGEGIDRAINVVNSMDDVQQSGQWIEKNGETVCSTCGLIADPLKVFGRIVWNYCPYCGTKMYGGAQ